MKRCLVVDRNLLAGFDITQRNKEDVVVKDLHERVWPTGMINVMRAVAAATAIQTPAIINCTDTQPPPLGPAIRFDLCNPLASVLRYFPSALEVRN